MTTKLIAIASALATTVALASAAEAGGGVRLGFGGPLGTFVATPSHGGGGAYAKPSHKRKAPALQAKRKPAKAAPRLARTEPTVAPQKAAPEKAAPENAEAATGDEASRITGSSALIQGTIPAEPPANDTAAIEAPADVAAKAQSEGAVTAATGGPETCKKFIPAIGMTVSVGCDE